MKYDTERNICYWLAKHLGIASHVLPHIRDGKLVKKDRTFIIPKKIYVYDREHDDDRWYEYEKVCGTQLFPFDKNFLKYVEIEFGWDGVYRSYIREKVKNVSR